MNVYQDVLPNHLIDTLIVHIQNSAKRKLEYNLSNNKVPDFLSKAKDILPEKLGCSFNTAIIKRYDINDRYISQAYKPHKDPTVFSKNPLVFCSLSGQAVLSVKNGQVVDIECQKGTIVVLRNNETHWVTPPKNGDGVRYFLFLGFKQ